MAKRIAVSGFSGRTYEYTLLAEAAPPCQAANLLIAERKRDCWRILHIGHTDYLPRGEWRGAVEQVRAASPAAELLYRLNVAHAVREAEAEDIGRLHRPARGSAEAA